jgi:multidrug resistance efflux pump
MMLEEEQFAESIRNAGAEVAQAELELGRAEATEKQVFAKLMIVGEHQGNKTAAAQTRYADASDEMFKARLERGKAKGNLAAAKANYLAAEVEFKQWQSVLASTRMEKRIYKT